MDLQSSRISLCKSRVARSRGTYINIYIYIERERDDKRRTQRGINDCIRELGMLGA